MLTLCFASSYSFENSTRYMTVCSNFAMESSLSKKLSMIPDRIRNRADVSRPNTIQSTVRSRCVEVTMNMLRSLSMVSDPVTYPSIARGLMLVGTSCPIRCMCVGISPYENGILPSMATALAYSPTHCIGSTPSIQVLSQAMSLCAVEIKDRISNKHGDMNTKGLLTRDEYTARFAMMLRHSYACTEAGVAFVNSSPMITKSISSGCVSSSIFSEWVAKLILIHAEFEYRLTVLCMGAAATECMDEATSAYPTLSSNMRLINMTNPAAIARMNVTTTEGSEPLSTRPTVGETYVDKILNWTNNGVPKASFRWLEYPDDVLIRFMGIDGIRPMVELLVDHAPGQLLNTSINTILNLYVTMSDLDIESFIENTGVNESASAGRHEETSGTTGGTEYHPETVGTSSNPQQSTPMNPFNNIESSDNSGRGGNDYNNNAGGGGGSSRKFEGPYGVTDRSQLAQLVDPTGKGVSQQVIIIDSFNQRANEILTSYKQVSTDMAEVVRRQTIIVDTLKKMGHSDESTVEDAKEFLNTFNDFCEGVMERMEEAYGLIEGLPAVVEGDRGIYELETMPVAPLLRRDDGKTMKQYVYGPAYQNARMNASENVTVSSTTDMNQSATPTASTSNPFNMSEEMTNNDNKKRVTSLMIDGDKTNIPIARELLIDQLKRTDFGNLTTSKTVYESLKNYPMNIGNTHTTMIDVMCTIVAQKMTLNSDDNLDEDEIESVISCLGEGSIENLEEIETIFAEAVMNDTSVTNFFEQLMAQENESDDTSVNAST